MILLFVLAQPVLAALVVASRRVAPLVMSAAASATPLCAALGRGALSTEERGALSSLLETRSGVRDFVSAYITGDEWAYADRGAPDELVASLATAAATSVDPESGEDPKEQARRAAGRAALLVRALRTQLAALESSLVELQAAIERKECEFDTSRNIWDILLEVCTRAMRLDESIDREGCGEWLRLIERYKYDAEQLAAIRRAIDCCE